MTLTYLKQNTIKAEYRDKRIIMYQMLSTLKKESMITQQQQKKNQKNRRTGISRIIYSCRISAFQFRKYISLLIETGLIDQREIQRKKGKSVFHYTITEKGLKYMQLMEDMKAMFDGDTTHYIFPESLDID